MALVSRSGSVGCVDGASEPSWKSRVRPGRRDVRAGEARLELPTCSAGSSSLCSSGWWWPLRGPLVVCPGWLRQTRSRARRRQAAAAKMVSVQATMTASAGPGEGLRGCRRGRRPERRRGGGATDSRDRLEDGGLNRRGDDDEPDDGDDLVGLSAPTQTRGGRAGQRRPGCATARRRCRRRPALLARGLIGPARRR